MSLEDIAYCPECCSPSQVGQKCLTCEFEDTKTLVYPRLCDVDEEEKTAEWVPAKRAGGAG